MKYHMDFAEKETNILAGRHSAAKTGTVADLGPIPIPRKNREMNKCHQVLVNAPQIQVKNENRAVTKMVHRLDRSAPLSAFRHLGGEKSRTDRAID